MDAILKGCKMVKRVPVPTFLESFSDRYDDEDENLDVIDVPTPKVRKRANPTVKPVVTAPPVVPPTRLQLGKVISK